MKAPGVLGALHKGGEGSCGLGKPGPWERLTRLFYLVQAIRRILKTKVAPIFCKLD